MQKRKIMREKGRLLTSRRCWLHLILVAYESWQLWMYRISQSESLRAMPKMINFTNHRLGRLRETKVHG